MKKKSYKGTALDLVQTVHMDKHNPLIYCYMVLDSPIDAHRLKQAVRSTAEIVPQILCRYNAEKHTWAPAEFDSHAIVKIVTAQEGQETLAWDLQTGPQLKINILRHRGGDRLQIGMSHILTDGAGFQQYLALLCTFYNKQEQQGAGANSTCVVPLLVHAAVRRLPQLYKYVSKHKGKSKTPFILSTEQGPGQLHTLKVTLSEAQLDAVHEQAKNWRVTLNDLFMASYACVLKSYITQSEIVLHCPADLRRFRKPFVKLTIANMTGNYLCRIPLSNVNGLQDITLAVYQEMKRQKMHYGCFHSILCLQLIHAVLPINLVRLIIKPLHSVEPVAYSNLGMIDANIFFQGTTIKECYICGTYRQAPSFQVSISTYKNVCTLAANMSGTRKQRHAALQLLNEIKSVLLQSLQLTS